MPLWPPHMVWHCADCGHEVLFRIPLASPPWYPCRCRYGVMAPLQPFAPQLPGQLSLTQEDS